MSVNTQHTKDKKKAALKALEESLGVVSVACRQIGLSRNTFYTWARVDKDFAKKAEEVSDIALDFAESQLFRMMKNGVPAAVIFYLKTKGKKRGYTETHEISLPNIRIIHEGNEDLQRELSESRLYNGQQRRNEIEQDLQSMPISLDMVTGRSDGGQGMDDSESD